MCLRAISWAMALSLMTSPLCAATLQVTQGTVQINRGQGFEPVTGSTTVNPGDVVTVQPGGNAQIVYPDGSIQPVQPGSVASVGPGSAAPAPVESGGQQVLSQAANPGGLPGGAGGAGGAAGGLGAGGLSGTAIAIGAVAVGVGIGVAVYVAQNQNKGASP